MKKALLAVLLLAAASQARAISGVEACQADAAKLCADDPRPGMCLERHFDKLTPECKAFKQRAKKKKKAAAASGKPVKKPAEGKP